MDLKRAVGYGLLGAILLGTQPVASHAQDFVFTGATGLVGMQTLLGNNNGGTPPPKLTGRREINWDAVGVNGNDANPATVVLSSGNLVQIPEGRFRGRGALFGDVTAVAATPGGVSGFSVLNPNFGDEFEFFSADRTFAPINANFLDVTFVRAGTNIPSFTNGFGAIFLDVETANLSGIEYFDLSGNSLGFEAAPVADFGPSGNASFIGKVFDTERIGRVRIFTGESSLFAPGVNDLSDRGNLDLVALDDFIYGEPLAAVPEPSAVALLFSGGISAGVFLRRRKR